MDQSLTQYNLPEEIEIEFKIQFDTVIRELNLSEMMNPPCMSINGEEPHTYEWCHTPSTLFAVHPPMNVYNTLEENEHMYMGKFIYSKKQNPVYLSNWSNN
tara:strand:- start:84 stop:386 length:303 start_codon:yes stop_codon:yes gene_type:complete